VEVKIGLQFLERRQNILFIVLEDQNQITSRNLSTSHQLKFGKIATLAATCEE
jgi:hypothetical protein